MIEAIRSQFRGFLEELQKLPKLPAAQVEKEINDIPESDIRVR